MDSSPPTTSGEQKQKHRSPSKIKRDAARVAKMRQAWHPPSTEEVATQTEDERAGAVAPIRDVDPRPIYQSMERSLQLARLEEPSVLTTALRHLVRVGHANGDKITFPVMEAVDRIHLKSMNLPTAHGELLTLVHEVFCRRGEVFDIEEIYKQAVKAHGRIAYDFTKPWPECSVHTYHP